MLQHNHNRFAHISIYKNEGGDHYLSRLETTPSGLCGLETLVLPQFPNPRTLVLGFKPILRITIMHYNQ